MNKVENTESCIQLDDDKCLKCDVDNYVIYLFDNDSVCCPLNYVWENGCKKKAANEEGLTECNFYSDVNTCRERGDNDTMDPDCS